MDQRYCDVLAKIANLISSSQPCSGSNQETPSPMATMGPYLRAFELQDRLHKLKVVHVAGSKGKGSTCAMVEGILRGCGYSTGLFTSPHLCDVRERVRINGRMVEKDIFVDASEWCLDRLNLVKEDYLQRFHPMAACFRFLFLLALKIFADANLDVIILEVGLGGRLDATNIIPNPTVCAVTSLGYEHTAILGSSLTQIASEKAGIFKPGSPAITIMQKPEALLALQAKAKIVGAEFSIAPNIDDTSDMTSLDSLGLSAGYQLENASLAVAVARKWEEIAPHINNRQGHQDRLAKLALGQLPEEYAQALRSLYWPGRAHTVKELDNLTFYLDGAHSPESIRACANWYPGFINDLSDCKKNVLLFSCGDDKDPEKLLKLLAHQLHKRAIKMGHAIFAPFIGTKDGLLELPTDSAASTTTKTQTLHLKAWQETMHSLYGGPEMSQKAPGTDSIVASSVKLSIDMVKDIASRSKDVRVLVTGSLYLVGNVLRILGRVPI